MKTKLCILVAVLCCAFASLSERTITGTVLDASQKPLALVFVSASGSSKTTQTNASGKYSISVPATTPSLLFNRIGYAAQKVVLGTSSVVNVTLAPETVVRVADLTMENETMAAPADQKMVRMQTQGFASGAVMRESFNTENYNPINENGFQHTSQQPVTTFSVDVDRAAYSNVRRFLNGGNLPPADAVRIEEMINYFEYDYPQPKNEKPLAVVTELTDSPWNKGLKIMHIGLQGKRISHEKLPASNLVFLIDVSGSMMDENKLPLLKQAFKLLTDQLRAEDHISIVTYAGSAGVVLPPTPGSEKMDIKEALDNLEAGGSTAGGAGIGLAYKLAKDHFKKGGNNRVILATDGDFNVGVSSEGELQRLIEEKRKDGIFLSVMGFGMGNYKDSHIETLADKGNGNYAYIDNIQEARKEFVQEFGGTLFTIAKDVKIQIEFNPRHVKAYRLIGYENRALKNEEFHDDQKDAGDMGSGHSVTALYEIVPAGASSAYLKKSDALKYQQNTSSETGKTNEMLTIKLRYKNPDSESSNLFEIPVENKSTEFAKCSENLRFAASVAQFGLLLRNSEYKGNASYDSVTQMARAAMGEDEEGYRSEFVRLVKTTKALDNRKETAEK